MKGQYEIVKNNSLTLIFVSFTKKNREYNFFSFSIFIRYVTYNLKMRYSIHYFAILIYKITRTLLSEIP